MCSGTYSNAQCCATDVLGLAGLNCANREYSPCLSAFPSFRSSGTDGFAVDEQLPSRLLAFKTSSPSAQLSVNRPNVARSPSYVCRAALFIRAVCGFA